MTHAAPHTPPPGHSQPPQTQRPPNNYGRRASDEDRWHVSKTLPITLVFSLVTMSVGGIWAFSAERTQTELHFADHDRRLDRLETAVDGQNRQINDLQRQIADKLAVQAELLARMQGTLDILVKQRDPGK